MAATVSYPAVEKISTCVAPSWLDRIHSCSRPFSYCPTPLSILLSWDLVQHIVEVWAQQSLQNPGVLGSECASPSLTFLSIICCTQLWPFQMLYSSFPHHTPAFRVLVFFRQYDEHLFT